MFVLLSAQTSVTASMFVLFCFCKTKHITDVFFQSDIIVLNWKLKNKPNFKLKLISIDSDFYVLVT